MHITRNFGHQCTRNFLGELSSASSPELPAIEYRRISRGKSFGSICGSGGLPWTEQGMGQMIVDHWGVVH